MIQEILTRLEKSGKREYWEKRFNYGPSAHTHWKAFLSWGMGVESNTIAVAWSIFPKARHFEGDLTVLTAQTGREYPSTKEQAEKYILPLFRENQFRFIEVARLGKKISDGIGIIQDTTSPTTLHIRRTKVGDRFTYTLADELKESGTIPLSGSTHLCSVHFKAEVLDPLIYWVLGDTTQPITHSFGYNSQESSRIQNSEAAFSAPKKAFTLTFGYSSTEIGRIERAKHFDHLQRKGIYPLQHFKLTRQDCLEFLADCFGETFQKSACIGCPFTRPTEINLRRKLEDIELIAEDLLIEHAALCMNPNNSIYPGKTLRSLIEQHQELKPIIDRFNVLLNSTEFGLYRVRRIYTAKGVPPSRSTEIVNNVPLGTKAIIQNGITYFVLREKEPSYPTSSEHYVLAPTFISEKVRGKREHFEQRWDEIVHGKRQRSLF